ncbi:hypothetical protein [Rhizobium sp. PAMB 3182]
MADLFEQKIGVEDVALLIGLPLDRAAFHADLRLRVDYPTDGRGDFATGEAEADPDGDRVARTLCELLQTAEDAGMAADRIHRAATFEALSEAAEGGAKVIVIVAHWREATISRRDLSEDAWAVTQRRAAQGASSILRDLGDFLAANGTAAAADGSDRLPDLLSSFIKGFDDDGDLEGDGNRVKVRDALDAVLGDVLAPGNGVEFRDAIHKPAVLAAALPERWSGICDLAICHSMGMARTLRAGRHDRRVIANRKPKYLARAVPELQETFLNLGHEPQSYLKLRSDIARLYGSMLLEL